MRIQPLQCEFFHRSPHGFHATPSAQAVAHSENVGDVDPAVAQAQENAQRFEILANTGGAAIESRRRKLHLILTYLFLEVVEHLLVTPPSPYLAKIAGNNHACKGLQNPIYPRVVLPKLPDSYLRRLLHAAIDAAVMQGVAVVRIPIRGILSRRSQRGEKRAGAYLSSCIPQVIGNPGIWETASAIRSHPRAGDDVEPPGVEDPRR